LVRWQGEYKGVEAVWLRWATFAGDLLPTESELTEQEKMRAEQERMRAEQERMRAQQEKMRAEDLEALLQRYRERFGDLPE
jgi:uncharacterized protein (DUF3084 family)